MRLKKAQMADTLQWIPATIIIFLIILVFLIFAGLMTGTKIIKGEKNSFDSNTLQGSLLAYSELRSFLESPVYLKNQVVKDHVFLWAESVQEGKEDSADLNVSLKSFAKETLIDGLFIIEYKGKKLVEKTNGKIKQKAEIKIPFFDSSISLKITDKVLSKKGVI